MATSAYSSYQNSSPRGVAMVLATVSAVVLSPLYVDRKNESRHEVGWSSGFVLPVVLAGLIVAIKTTSFNSMQRGSGKSVATCPDESTVLRIGSSSWGLASILIMLVFILSWQASVQHFFWR
ncbi:unnamed protein product [Fraxinus pennsylvanica]|uniref:Uncharacterized protein n=1 Tax=Fraxinus pennsylvanica TaxID=56036 RepID=A0AAD1ZEQ5_9LAMI|nr:unnamed protein product [Fraxinus pennsylvanica]